MSKKAKAKIKKLKVVITRLENKLNALLDSNSNVITAFNKANAYAARFAQKEQAALNVSAELIKRLIKS